jgi:hypothetical protein
MLIFSHLDKKIVSFIVFDLSLLCPQQPATKLYSQTLESISNPCFIVIDLLILCNLISSSHQHHMNLKHFISLFYCQIHICSTHCPTVSLL